MKKMKLHISILFILITFSNIKAQQDSAKIEFSQERITKDTKLNEAICDVLTRREQKSKDIWKFNLLGTFFGGFNIAYERKLTPLTSINIHSVTTIKSPYGDSYGISSTEISNMSQELSFEWRFYYNQNKRIRLGKKAGFSGNYIGFALNNMYYYYNYNSFGKIHEVNNSLILIYGIQRKIGKVGYIDFNAGIGPKYYTFFKAPSHNYSYNILESKSSIQLGWNFQVKLGFGIAF